MQTPNNEQLTKEQSEHIFTGNVFILQAYDVGDDINLQAIEQERAITIAPLHLPKYFKQYHIPLAVEPPHPHATSHRISSKIHSFGALSFTYKIPFTDTLDNLRNTINKLANTYQELSVNDARVVYKKINKYIAQPNFFQTSSSYIVIQIYPQPHLLDLTQLQKHYGGVIASMLRFETETLSEFQKNEVLQSAVGYFRGSLIVIDVDAAFAYEEEYDDILHLFEFANIHQLELRYFDRLLDDKLNLIYERAINVLPWRAYLPFFSSPMNDPMSLLGKLRADISVITERLESNVKLAGEPYYSEIYNLLVEKFDLKNLHSAIERKLRIVEDVQTVHQRKIDTTREDLLSVLIIVLIFIELVVGILSYMR